MSVSIALAALAAAQAAAPAAAANPQWVPLKQISTTTQAAPVVAASATPIAAPVMANALLRVVTEVPLRLSEELTTKGKELRVGARFQSKTRRPRVLCCSGG